MKSIIYVIISALILFAGCTKKEDTSPREELFSKPTANAGSSLTIHTLTTLTLDASKSSDSEAHTLSYQWSITSKPSNAYSSVINPNTINPTFTPDVDGEYIIQLIVKNRQFSSSASFIKIIASNILPISNAGEDQIISPQSLVQLSSQQSYDEDNDTLTYSWTIVEKPNSSAALISDENLKNPVFLADKSGEYLISLSVHDGINSSEVDTVSIIANNAPTADAGNDRTFYLQTALQLDGSSSISNNSNPLNYQWSIFTKPDGSQSSITDPNIVNPTFIPDIEGTYVIELIVNDGVQDSNGSRISLSVESTLSTAVCFSSQEPKALHGYNWHLNAYDNNFTRNNNINPSSSICLENAWEYTKGEGVLIAIIDDSFEVSHDDMNSSKITTYNVSTRRVDVSNSSNYASHGTHTAGVISASDNSVGGVGVAPNADLLLIKVDFFSTQGFDSEIIEAFEYAKNAGAKVINNSWGTDNVSEIISAEIRSIVESNITVVFSAGNSNKNLDGSIEDESELPFVIGVGGSSEYSTKSTYSNYGSNIDIVAPSGENIGVLTTDELGFFGDNKNSELNGEINNNYHLFKGTSASAPIVSGVSALILSINPNLTPSQVREIIINSADKIGNVAYDDVGFNLEHAYGKINAERAVKLAKTY